VARQDSFIYLKRRDKLDSRVTRRRVEAARAIAK
jgi:hypothetical protein